MTVVTDTDPTPQDVSFGCTVADVLRYLPHVQLGAPLEGGAAGGNEFYRSPQVRRLTEEDVAVMIQRAGSRVLARIYRYEQVPERVREHIRVMARDLVAVGAAWFTQAALHPAASGPNNLSSAVADLRERFHTDLDEVRATIDAEIETPTPGLSAGSVAGYAPPAWFPDGMRF